MNIRRAEERDIPALIRLLEQILNVHQAGRPDIFRPHTKKYTQEELLSLLSHEKTPIFVAEDREVLGYAFCVLQEQKDHPLFQDRKSLYVDDLCVDEACRGRGIGKALMAFVTDYAKSLCCHSVTLNVWALNDKALKFYADCGMSPQKYTMEKILTSQA